VPGASLVIHVNTYHARWLAAAETRRDVQGVQRCHPLQVHYVLRDTTGSRALVLVCVAKQARANELIAEGDGYIL
jgi:hypothetical protein